MNKKRFLLAFLIVMFCVGVVAAQRIRKHGGLIDINSAGGVLVTPLTGQTVAIGGAATVAGSLTATGQLVTTRDPANTTNTSASLVVNPATSASNELLVGVLDNGTTRFSVDKEGDAVIGASITVGTGNALTKIAKYTATLTPAAVAANTCAEQTFTVTGITASDIVFVNKPTAQAGLGVAGVRASGTNEVGINFCNTTGSEITPTAAQVYLFGAIR